MGSGEWLSRGAAVGGRSAVYESFGESRISRGVRAARAGLLEPEANARLDFQTVSDLLAQQYSRRTVATVASGDSRSLRCAAGAVSACFDFRSAMGLAACRSLAVVAGGACIRFDRPQPALLSRFVTSQSAARASDHVRTRSARRRGNQRQCAVAFVRRVPAA